MFLPTRYGAAILAGEKMSYEFLVECKLERLIIGEVTQNFSKMLELQGPQNCKMVALQRPKMSKDLQIALGAATDFERYIAIIHHI